jgi:hypothetical protein
MLISVLPLALTRKLENSQHNAPMTSLKPYRLLLILALCYDATSSTMRSFSLVTLLAFLAGSASVSALDGYTVPECVRI